MAVYIRCKKEDLDKCLKEAESVLFQNQLQFDGYKQGLFEAVRKQTECSYDAVYQVVPMNQMKEVIWGDWCGLYPAAQAELAECSERVRSFASYDLALLTKAGLHPLLIPCRGDLLIGVWLYEDFDYEEPVIHSQEFLSESYEQGGMLLAFSVTSQVAGASFSRAVQAAERHLQDYICALDVALENKEVESFIVMEEEPVLEAEAQVEEIVEEPVPTVEEVEEPIEVRRVDLNTGISEISELILKAMQTEEALLVSGDASLASLKESLDKLGLLPFMFDPSKEDLTAAKERILSLTPLEKSKRLEMSLRLYGENQKKYENYLDILESETLPGMSLISLMESASEEGEEVYSLPASDSAQKVIFETDQRAAYRDYCNAWEQCICKTPSGTTYLDLTSFSQSEIKQFKDMTSAAERVIEDFLTALNRFGYEVGKIYDPQAKGTQKEYFRSLMTVTDYLVACLDLYEAMKADVLPETTAEEERLYVEYQEYRIYREALDKNRSTIYLKGISALKGADLEKIKNLADSLLEEDLDAVSIPIPRRIVKFCDEYESVLKQYKLIPEETRLAPRSGKGKNAELIALCELLTKVELIVKYADHYKYDTFYKNWGPCKGDPAYILGLKENLNKQHELLVHDKGLDDACKKNMEAFLSLLAEAPDDLSKEQVILMRHAESLLWERYIPFHEMEKEIFGFAGLSYRTFDETYPDKMLMEFILEWKELLDSEKEYENFIHQSAILDRACLGSFGDQARACQLSPNEANDAFAQFFMNHAAVFWMKEKGFDLTEYEMTLRSLKASESIRQEAGRITNYNRLLEHFKNKEGALSVGIVDLDQLDQYLAAKNAKPGRFIILLGACLEKDAYRALMQEAEEVLFYELTEAMEA